MGTRADNYNGLTKTPINTAIEKLNRVPTRTYSFLPLEVKRSIDFAAIINPTAVNWPERTNTKTKYRSTMPINLPAFGKLLSGLSPDGSSGVEIE